MSKDKPYREWTRREILEAWDSFEPENPEPIGLVVRVSVLPDNLVVLIPPDVERGYFVFDLHEQRCADWKEVRRYRMFGKGPSASVADLDMDAIDLDEGGWTLRGGVRWDVVRDVH